MRLSPLDIYNKEFNKTTFGYSTVQVEDFLEEVGLAYEKLMKELNALQDENERLKEKLANYENIEENLHLTLTRIQEVAKEQTQQAKKEAEMIIKSSEMKAEKIIEQAKLKMQEEYRLIEQLKENKEFFRIRFKTLLESHLQMLEEDIDQLPSQEDIAVSKFELDE